MGRPAAAETTGLRRYEWVNDHQISAHNSLQHCSAHCTSKGVIRRVSSRCFASKKEGHVQCTTSARLYDDYNDGSLGWCVCTHAYTHVCTHEQHPADRNRADCMPSACITTCITTWITSCDMTCMDGIAELGRGARNPSHTCKHVCRHVRGNACRHAHEWAGELHKHRSSMPARSRACAPFSL